MLSAVVQVSRLCLAKVRAIGASMQKAGLGGHDGGGPVIDWLKNRDKMEVYCVFTGCLDERARRSVEGE